MLTFNLNDLENFLLDQHLVGLESFLVKVVIYFDLIRINLQEKRFNFYKVFSTTLITYIASVVIAMLVSRHRLQDQQNHWYYYCANNYIYNLNDHIKYLKPRT